MSSHREFIPPTSHLVPQDAFVVQQISLRPLGDVIHMEVLTRRYKEQWELVTTEWKAGQIDALGVDESVTLAASALINTILVYVGVQKVFPNFPSV